MAPIQQPKKISAGEILFLSKDANEAHDRNTHCRIHPGKLDHMVVVLHVEEEDCAIVCLITSKSKLGIARLRHQYRVIRTEPDINQSYLPRAIFRSIHVHIISGVPFTTTSYINIGEPFLVGRGDLEGLRWGKAQAIIKVKELRRLIKEVAEITPAYKDVLGTYSRRTLESAGPAQSFFIYSPDYRNASQFSEKCSEDSSPTVLYCAIGTLLFLLVWVIAENNPESEWSIMWQYGIQAMSIALQVVVAIMVLFVLAVGYMVRFIFGDLLPWLWQRAGIAKLIM